MALALVIFGVVASPFCLCIDDHHSAAAAEEAHHHAEGDHHSGHHHDEGSADSDHACECPALAATMPVGVGQNVGMMAVTFVGFEQAPSIFQFRPGNLVVKEPGVDQDIGPPVPASQFAVLRP